MDEGFLVPGATVLAGEGSTSWTPLSERPVPESEALSGNCCFAGELWMRHQWDVGCNIHVPPHGPGAGGHPLVIDVGEGLSLGFGPFLDLGQAGSYSSCDMLLLCGPSCCRVGCLIAPEAHVTGDPVNSDVCALVDEGLGST